MAVGVSVGNGVAVGVSTGVAVWVGVGVKVGVEVLVGMGVSVAVGVKVGVSVGVDDGVGVGVVVSTNGNAAIAPTNTPSSLICSAIGRGSPGIDPPSLKVAASASIIDEGKAIPHKQVTNINTKNRRTFAPTLRDANQVEKLDSVGFSVTTSRSILRLDRAEVGYCPDGGGRAACGERFRLTTVGFTSTISFRLGADLGERVGFPFDETGGFPVGFTAFDGCGFRDDACCLATDCPFDLAPCARRACRFWPCLGCRLPFAAVLADGGASRRRGSCS